VAGARTAPDGREFADSQKLIIERPPEGLVRANTTLAVVATNAALSKVEATKLARLAGLGMARAIYPVNTGSDGDTTFALSLGSLRANIDSLGAAAADCVVQSILRAVRAARSMGGLPGLG
jgi:L-aminopeptidase/D-esterase-like protein